MMPGWLLAGLLATFGADATTTSRLRQQGHPRLATSVSIITMVIRGSAVTFNLTQLRKAERAR